jgi:hypothetical protein
MEHLSSPPSLNTTISPDSAKQSAKQPTFTTAGTLYNPGAAQPLQPPTRRGRTLNWPTRGTQSDLSLFPRDSLAGLALKTQAGRVPPPAARPVPQYSPLQQNYDRAVSPATEQEMQILDSLGMSAPRMRSGNVPAGQLGLPSCNTSRHGDENMEEEDDDEDYEDLLGNGMLAGLTVKSLSNLASYPNPSQQRAQKALQRARMAHGVQTPVPDFAADYSVSTSVSYGSPEPTKVRPHSPSMLRVAHSDPVVLSRLQADIRNRGDPLRPVRSGQGSGFLISSKNGQKPGFLTNGGYTTTLSTGPGAPRPLTAGPPGQRQYRASTFESTIKALQVSGKPKYQWTTDEAYTFGGPRAAHLRKRVESLTASSESATSSSTSAVQQATPQPGAIAPPRRSEPKSVVAALDAMTRLRYHDTRSMEDILEYYPNAPPPHYGRKQSSRQAPQQRPPLVVPSRQPGQDGMSEEQVLERDQEIDRQFFARTNRLGKGQLESITELSSDLARRNIEHVSGKKIGDGAMDTKVVYPFITTEESNATSVAEHAKPLVNMLFCTLLTHKEEVAGQTSWQFEVPAPWQIARPSKERNPFFGNRSTVLA